MVALRAFANGALGTNYIRPPQSIEIEIVSQSVSIGRVAVVLSAPLPARNVLDCSELEHAADTHNRAL